MMKRLLANLLIALAVVVSVPSAASAQYDPTAQACRGASDASICQTDGENNPISGEDGVIMRVVNILSFVVGGVSVMMIIYGGLKLVFSNGDSTAVSTARKSVIYALIGIAVFISSQLIVRFLLSRI